MGYIDADKLIAILNDRIERCEKDEEDGYPDTTSSEATLKSILSVITSLQQEGKSEDFEEHWREFEDWADSYNTADYPTAYTRKDIARHFYELGLNTRKK